jgi:hypothetical protein
MTKNSLTEAREAFHVAKLALTNVRLLSDVEQARETSTDIAELVEARIRADELNSPVPLLHQASFLQFAYICLVWLWERALADGERAYVAEGVCRRFDVAPLLEKKTGPRGVTSAADVLRLVRNAISHARVKADDNAFDFTDQSPKEEGPTCLTLTWQELGALSEAVLFTMNELLWPAEPTPGGLANTPPHRAADAAGEGQNRCAGTGHLLDLQGQHNG